MFENQGFGVKGTAIVLGYDSECVFLFPCGVREDGLVNEEV